MVIITEKIKESRADNIRLAHIARQLTFSTGSKRRCEERRRTRQLSITWGCSKENLPVFELSYLSLLQELVLEVVPVLMLARAATPE